MKCFVVGTDTDVGKTCICAWLCFHSKFSYFKPIQTGSNQQTDRQYVQHWAKVHCYDEIYCYEPPVSPHLATWLNREVISLNRLTLPNDAVNLIIEGVGGLLVPLNPEITLIDWIQSTHLPVILVARSGLGTLNHSLLSIEALRARNIELLGVIMNGPLNPHNAQAIAFYGKTQILAQIPQINPFHFDRLCAIELGKELNDLLKVT
jgi:dethiobiotin synthetase